MRLGVMVAVCMVAAAGVLVGGCSHGHKNAFLPFSKAASKATSTQQPMVRTANSNANAIEKLFKQTPAQKRQQAKAWKNFQKTLGDILSGGSTQTAKK